MGPFVFGISFLVLLVGVLLLIIHRFRNKSTRLARYLLVTGFVLLVVSMFLSSSKQNLTNDKNKIANSREDDDTIELIDTENTDGHGQQVPSEESEKIDGPEEENSVESDQNNSSELQSAVVSRIVDGDTLEIIVEGATEKVRLLLVDTPETVHSSKPIQPFGPEASDFAKRKLSGKQIKVEYDGPKRDHYDRLLAYIWVDGEMFNQLLLEEGLARLAYIYDPPYTHYGSYVKAQTKAVNAKKRIWSINGYVTEDGFRDPSTSSENSQASHSSDLGTKSNDTKNVKFDPHGPDRDCGDFDTQQQAQNFFKLAGGTDRDPHRLDEDENGVACENL